jgi:hypothetical protein
MEAQGLTGASVRARVERSGPDGGAAAADTQVCSTRVSARSRGLTPGPARSRSTGVVSSTIQPDSSSALRRPRWLNTNHSLPVAEVFVEPTLAHTDVDREARTLGQEPDRMPGLTGVQRPDRE